MINDQSMISARAEKPNAVLGRGIVRKILTALLAAAALMLPSLAAWGMDSLHDRPTPTGAFDRIALPPIPYLDTMPWMKWNAGVNTLKIDTLMTPAFPDIRLVPARRDKAAPAIS